MWLAFPIICETRLLHSQVFVKRDSYTDLFVKRDSHSQLFVKRDSYSYLCVERDSHSQLFVKCDSYSYLFVERDSHSQLFVKRDSHTYLYTKRDFQHACGKVKRFFRYPHDRPGIFQSSVLAFNELTKRVGISHGLWTTNHNTWNCWETTKLKVKLT